MTSVHLRLMTSYATGGTDDDFNGVVDLARVPVVGDEIEHDGATCTVKHVVFYTDGSAPYVVARWLPTPWTRRMNQLGTL